MAKTEANVNTPAPEWESMKDVWAMIAALLGGTKAMRAAGDKYLPKFEHELQKNYDRRLSTSTLVNVYAETVRDLVGLPFSKAPKTDDVPDGEFWSNLHADVTGDGANLHMFARMFLEAGLSRGAAHILVDRAPKTDENESLAESEKRRPYWNLIYPHSLIDARTAKVDGYTQYTHVRIRETATEFSGFEEATKERVREITPPYWRVWEKDGDEWKVVRDGAYDMPYVTMASFFAGERTGRFTARPPLENLAYLNVGHWQSRSDQHNILSFARFAFLFLSGVNRDQTKQLSIGPHTVLEGPPGSKAEMVEHSGAAIEAGRNDLNDRLDEMAAAGSQLTVKRPQPTKTATENVIETVQEQSDLERMTIEMAEAINLARQFSAAWVDKPHEPKDVGAVAFNTKFGTVLNAAQRADTLNKMRERGDIALTDYLSQMRSIGYLSDEFDIDAAIEALDDDTTLAGFGNANS